MNPIDDSEAPQDGAAEPAPVDGTMSKEARDARHARKNRWRRLPWLVPAVAGIPLWCCVALLLDVNGRRRDPEGRFDAIVVAGCRVLPGGRASPSLARRATKAVEMWRRGIAPVIAFTGGVGTSPPAEAAAAASVARELGVPNSALLLESRSTSTLENARYLSEVSKYRRIVVVTDTYHVRRCEWFFGLYFESARGVGVVSPLAYRARGALREALAYAYYLVTSRWTLPDPRPR